MTDNTKERDTADVVYDFIRDFIAQHNYAPSVRDIAKACFIGYATVMWNLDKLERQQRICREPGVARGIWLAKTN